MIRDHRRAFLFLAAVILWLAAACFGGPASTPDAAVLAAFYAKTLPLLSHAAWGVTQIGGWIALSLAAAAAMGWLWLRGRKRDAVFLLAVVLGARIIVALQKLLFERDRPDLAHLVDVGSAAFPSGHAANSMVTFLILAVLLRGTRTALGFAIILSGVVGISRLMLGVHWPSDVIGGWSFACAWVLAALTVRDRLSRRAEKSREQGRRY